MNSLIFAHRGASKLVKFENTIEAFDKAFEIGALGIEFDVRKTKDNIFVCCHDDKIEGKYIKNLTYSELIKISKNIGFEIPIIEDILKKYKNKLFFDIELKERKYEKDIIKVIKKHLTYDEYVITSFNDSTIKKVKNLDKNIQAGLLLDYNLKNPIKKMLNIFPELRILYSKADFVAPHYKLVDFFFKLRMDILKKDLYVWTVNEEIDIKKLLEKNVKSIITDYPDIAINIKNKYFK